VGRPLEGLLISRLVLEVARAGEGEGGELCTWERGAVFMEEGKKRGLRDRPAYFLVPRIEQLYCNIWLLLRYMHCSLSIFKNIYFKIKGAVANF
jgi:hypothetical protein